MRNQHFNATKIGLSFAFLKQKAKLYWDNLPEAQKAGRDFKASTGWLCGVLKNNHFSSHIIHREGGEVSDANKQLNTKKIQSQIHEIVNKYNILFDCIYNADQIGLYYNKLPNRMYMKKEHAKTTRGSKLMKSKD